MKSVRAILILLLAGCGSLIGRPDYIIVKTPSFQDRLQEYADWRVNNSAAPTPVELDLRGKADMWGLRFWNAIRQMHVWVPNIERMSEHFGRVAAKYGITVTNGYKSRVLELLKELLARESLLTAGPSVKKDVPESLEMRCRGMLLRADNEHPEFLVRHDQIPSPPDLAGLSHPNLLSTSEPACVSLAIVNPGKVEADTKPPGVSVVVNNAILGSVDKKDEAEKEEKKPGQYLPIQDLHLSISTVLNSPDVLDQIDYVTTYVYFFPFQYPANGSVVLEDEFWNAFFSLQLSRPQGDDLIAFDLERALLSIRLRIDNVATQVKYIERDFGQVLQKNKDSFTAGLTGSYSPSSSLTGIAPTLSFTGEAGSEVTTKILRQLDQRSTYISTEGDFLRITQRGMSAANLAGRFNEKVTLRVPASGDPIPVIVPGKGKFEATIVTQPIYSKVDAVTFSVVVVRHPTKLRSTSADTYGLPDVMSAADAAIIASVTRPAHIRLWQWDRTLFEVQQADLLGFRRAATPARQVPCSSLAVSDVPGHFTLAGCSVAEAMAAVGHIRSVIDTELAKDASLKTVLWEIADITLSEKGGSLTVGLVGRSGGDNPPKKDIVIPPIPPESKKK